MEDSVIASGSLYHCGDDRLCHLFIACLAKAKKALQQARRNRINRIKESIEIIAKAMLNDDCNLSEGVLRLKMLLEPVGMSIKNHVTMLQLYEVVETMPTHEARKALKKERTYAFRFAT